MEESEGIFWLLFSFPLSFLAQIRIRYITGYGVNFSCCTRIISVAQS